MQMSTKPAMYRYTCIWDTQTDLALMSVSLGLLRFLGETFGNKVRMCTEFKRDVYTFRCHPCYQSDGPIYDWMLVKFEGYADTYPCRLAAVVINDVFDINTVGSKPYKLVIQSTTK